MDMNAVVGRYSNELFVKGAVVDGAEAQSVADRGFTALVAVAEDVSSVEQTCFLEPADRTLIRVGGQHASAETRLVESDACLSHGVPTFNRIVG